MSYAESVRRGVELALKAEPRAIVHYLEARDRLSEGHYGWWQDAVMQREYRAYDLYDAAIFAEIQAAIHQRQIAHARLVGLREARSDVARKENEMTLAMLTAPFSAGFVGGRRGPDGWLAWNEPIELDWTFHGEKVGAYCAPPRKPSEGIPLEVGYTYPETTLWRLAQHRALARWPYGNDFILILVVTDDELWRR
jgi:hypothetical protein